MKLILIAAHDENLVIGNEGRLPWHYSEDLKHFKARTMGKPVVMGRGVFEELHEKPLPGRRNVVLSTTKNYEHVEQYHTLEAALHALKEEPVVYIIGGGHLYRQTIARADRLEITHIKKSVPGDVFFPEYRTEIGTVWMETHRESHPEFDFVDYDRLETGQSQ